MPSDKQQLTAKARYRQRDQAATISFPDDTHLALHFEQPQFAITPGQSVVIYAGDICLGGALIDVFKESI